MPARKRTFARKTGFRDSRLIVVVSEGEVTEQMYFSGLVSRHLGNNSKVHVEVIKKNNNTSDPKHCLSYLDAFKKRYHLNATDELWLVCDVDRWGEKKLAEVNKLCRQKGYCLAISNPCFELWLLLHFVDLEKLKEKELIAIKKNCTGVTNYLRKTLGSFSKTSIDIEQYSEHIETAIMRGKSIDKGEDWPNQLGSKVWSLLESILSLS